MADLHPAIETFLAMDDRREIVVCLEIRDQLKLAKRRLRVHELRAAYNALIAESAEAEPEDDIEMFDTEIN